MRKFFYFLSNNVCTRSESDDIISPFYDYIYALYRNTFGRKNLFHDYAVPRYFLKSRLNQQVFLYFLDSYALFVLLITKNIFQESDAQAKPFLANVITIAVCYS